MAHSLHYSTQVVNIGTQTWLLSINHHVNSNVLQATLPIGKSSGSWVWEVSDTVGHCEALYLKVLHKTVQNKSGVCIGSSFLSMQLFHSSNFAQSNFFFHCLSPYSNTTWTCGGNNTRHTGKCETTNWTILRGKWKGRPMFVIWVEIFGWYEFLSSYKFIIWILLYR